MRNNNDEFLCRIHKLLPDDISPDFIRRYTGLYDFVKKVLSPDGYNATLLVGRPGNGKSTPFEKALEIAEYLGESPPLAVSTTHNTACALHQFAYENLDRLLVIDDDRALFKDKKVINLLMGLCDTRPDGKRMTWNSQNPAHRKAGIPSSFITRSRVVIINNSIESAENVLDALNDRVNVVVFDPPPSELHEHATWADPDVWDFIGENLHLAPHASFRWYVRAAEKKRNGDDWRAWLIGVWLRDPSMKLFVQVQNDLSLVTVADRVRRFEELGRQEYLPASRATYFRLAKAHPHLVRKSSVIITPTAAPGTEIVAL